MQDLLLYLLQLVQALKYENYEDIQEEFNKVDNGKDSFVGACQDSRDSISERYNFDKAISINCFCFFLYKYTDSFLVNQDG